jgi:Replication protein
MLAEATREFAQGAAGGQSPPALLLPFIHGHKLTVFAQPRNQAAAATSPAKQSKSSVKRRRELSSSKASAQARAIRLNNRWKQTAALQASLVASLEKVGRRKLAFAVQQCHTSFRGWQCKPCHSPWAQATFSCSVRLCPWEMRKRSARARHQFDKLITHLSDPRYIVLSMRNCGLHELRSGIQMLVESFGRLRRSVLWKASVKGALVTLEVTFKEKTKTWHPHLNILTEGNGKFIQQDALAAAWRNAARDEGLILPFIKKADSGTARELLKYITKLADFVHIPEAVGAFLDSTRKTRFLRTYGCFYGLKLSEDDEAGAETVLTCPDCGSKDVIPLRRCFSRDDVYLDGAGRLRFCISADPFTVRSYDG